MAVAAPKMQRTVGHARLSLKKALGRTRIDVLYQKGAAKIRLPKTHNQSVEAVLINSAGGVTGGDDMQWEISAGEGTQSVITTQACEKIYKSTGDTAHVSARLHVGEQACLDWLPQETILFNRSRLRRTLDVTLEHNARFMAVEAIMLGREAMGEQVTHTFFHDRWRIHRNDRLIHADDIRLDGNIPDLKAAKAILDGQAAFASFVYCGPEDDETLEAVVGKLRENAQNLGIGVSRMNGKITARFVGKDCYHLRQDLIPFLENVRSCVGTGAALPKVWNL